MSMNADSTTPPACNGDYNSDDDSDWEHDSHPSSSDSSSDDGSDGDDDLELDDESAGEPGALGPTGDADDMAQHAAAEAAAAAKKAATAAQRHPMTADYNAKRIVHFSIDVEHGGPKCGLLSISGYAWDSYTDTILGQFHEFIKPGPTAIWNLIGCQQSHKLHRDHPDIVNAATLETVWDAFVDWLECFLGNGEKFGCIIAWKGAKCDMEEFFKLTDVRHMRKPRGVKYFWDPLDTISKYTTCELNKCQFPPDQYDYKCETVWKYVTGNPLLVGAHNSLVDAKAQLDIVRWMAGVCGP